MRCTKIVKWDLPRGETIGDFFISTLQGSIHFPKHVLVMQ